MVVGIPTPLVTLQFNSLSSHRMCLVTNVTSHKMCLVTNMSGHKICPVTECVQSQVCPVKGVPTASLPIVGQLNLED